jgi:hypothetical protein
MVKQDVAISYYFRHVRLFMHIMHGTYVRNVLELTELDTAPYVCTSRYDGVCYSLCPRNKTSLFRRIWLPAKARHAQGVAATRKNLAMFGC